MLSSKVNTLISPASRERFLMNLSRYPAMKLIVIPPAKAAVLVPLCVVNNTLSLLYTVRSLELRTNRGQISFPGGKIDNNETPVEAALRETEEEIGILRNRIDVWGQGPSFPGKSNKIVITPIVGFITDYSQQELKINPKEVSEVFTTPIDELCQPQNQSHTQFTNGHILPVFLVQGYRIWGITAYITHIVLSCLLPREMYKNEWKKNKVGKPNIK